MKVYLCQHKHYSEKAFESIDWYAIGKASKSLTLQNQIWVTKYVSGFFAHGDRIHKRGLWENNLCPMCGKYPEIATHLLTCNDPKSRHNTTLQ